MRCSHLARFGVVVVALAFAAHEAAAQQGMGMPGAMNPRMGGSRGPSMAGPMAGSSVPMMAPQRAMRQQSARSFDAPNRLSGQVSAGQFGNMFSGSVMRSQNSGGAVFRSSEAMRAQAKTINGAGAFGLGSVRAR